MKQYFVYGRAKNVYLYLMGFDYISVEDSPNGVRFYYENSSELRKAIRDYKNDEFWSGLASADRLIEAARHKARVAYKQQQKETKIAI